MRGGGAGKPARELGNYPNPTRVLVPPDRTWSLPYPNTQLRSTKQSFFLKITHKIHWHGSWPARLWFMQAFASKNSPHCTQQEDNTAGSSHTGQKMFRPGY